MQPDEKLRQFATDKQWEYYEAYCNHGGYRAAAGKTGLHHSTIQSAVKTIFAKAELKGYSPDHGMTRTVPDSFNAARISTNYDAEGNIRQQWVIATVDKEKQREAILAAVEGFKDEIPRAKPVPSTRNYNENTMTVYPVGDHHIGMLAWGEETGGDDHDVSISDSLLIGSVNHLIKASPPSSHAALVLLGDFLHFDSMQAVTPTNRNLLDSDTRFPKVVRVAIHVLRKSIELMLKKHETVHLLIETGNHDESSSVWLREMFNIFYENEPRVYVDTSPMLFHFIEFGKNMIGTHHGDKVKMDKLPLIMASMQPEVWGRTRYRHILTGHIHNDSAKDHPGCKVESFRVLPPADAYAASHGYACTGRDMKSIIYHKEYGEIGRNTVNPAMLI